MLAKTNNAPRSERVASRLGAAVSRRNVFVFEWIFIELPCEEKATLAGGLRSFEFPPTRRQAHRQEQQTKRASVLYCGLIPSFLSRDSMPVAGSELWRHCAPSE